MNYFDSLVQHGKLDKDRVSNQEYEVKLREGTTQKEKLVSMLDESFSLASSTEELLQLLEEQDISPYYRNGKLTGVSYGRKYRFSRLNYIEQLQELEKQSERIKELEEIRDRGNDQSIERDDDSTQEDQRSDTSEDSQQEDQSERGDDENEQDQQSSDSDDDKSDDQDQEIEQRR
ncbi:MAG: hypothetical protein IIA45_14555 [Bacteroidetes bacterium]|nr:hypothetical protein [Bacteroidota bacterium]